MIKKCLFFLIVVCPFLANAQTSQVSGRVTNVAGDPLIGANVIVRESSRGVSTNVNGEYTISVANGETLVFSYLGADPQEIVYQGQQTLNVTLSDQQDIDEVVVIGYQTIRKADLTGAVAVFNPNTMKNTTVKGNIGEALQTVPGVFARSGGAPGNEGMVEIRGTGTLSGSAPLYVVDGMVSGANRDFNFNDIESIQVLKDASAAAIYGSRAGNGVIIITTKQGLEGPMQIEVSTRNSIQWLPRYDIMGREDWIALNDMAFDNAKRARANHSDANTDWQDVVFKNGLLQDHNISFRGGSQTGRYFFSANYQANSGATIGSQSDRLTIRSNTSGSRNFGNKFVFRVGENVAISHFKVDELNTNPMLDVLRMLPTIPVYDENNFGGFGHGNASLDQTFGVNPVAREHIEDTRNSNLRIRGNAFMELEFNKVLTYRFSTGFNFSNDKYRYLRKEGDWTVNQPYDPSILTSRQAQYQELVYDNTLNYNQSFGKHNISAVVGTSFLTSNYQRVQGTKNDVIVVNDSEYLLQLNGAMSNPKTEGYKDQDKLFSIFGRVNYNYDDRYLFSLTIRRDESSKFNPDDRVGYFPSGSFGWRMSRESFFDVSWINDLKLRANYGVLGVSNIGNYEYVGYINNAPQVVFGNAGGTIQTAMTQLRLANWGLKWETMEQFNIGADIEFLSNRLSLQADYFIKTSKDVLFGVPILMVTGNSGDAPRTNAVTMRNNGIEFVLGWRDRLENGFSYFANFNGSYLKNKIKKIGYNNDPIDSGFTFSRIGNPIGQWSLIKTDGIFQSLDEVLAHTNSEGKVIQPNAQPGDIRYIDYNDDGQITDADKQYCGESIPKTQLGLNAGIEFKGFDLQILMTGAFGHKIFNGPRSTIDRFDDNSNYRKDYDAWSETNRNAKDPRPIIGDSRNARGDQDRWLENGNYIKIKQIAVGYNFPKAWMGNVISSMRVFVNLENMITFTKYTGLDPEFNNSSIWMRSHDYGVYPAPRSVTIGAQVTF